MFGFNFNLHRYTEGATAFITRSPCNKCLPALIAGGVVRVVYGVAISRHTSGESAARQLDMVGPYR